VGNYSKNYKLGKNIVKGENSPGKYGIKPESYGTRL
jgi:hypothetical protein